MRMQLIAMIAVLAAGCGRTDPAPTERPPERATAVEGRKDADRAPPVSKNACRTQGGLELPANALKAVGTEPFWGARIDGRCVTYATPENQQGTRIWTKFTGTRDAGRWEGSLGKDSFVFVTRPDSTCSDGMSDRVYPIAVTLEIGSEERNGCAEPI